MGGAGEGGGGGGGEHTSEIDGVFRPFQDPSSSSRFWCGVCVLYVARQVGKKAKEIKPYQLPSFRGKSRGLSGLQNSKL